MGKIKSLHGEGVRDLFSYEIGKRDGREELLDSIRTVMRVNQDGLKFFTGLQAMSLLLASFTAEEEKPE